VVFPGMSSSLHCSGSLLFNGKKGTPPMSE
jgi:hypothetical protein